MSEKTQINEGNKLGNFKNITIIFFAFILKHMQCSGSSHLSDVFFFQSINVCCAVPPFITWEVADLFDSLHHFLELTPNHVILETKQELSAYLLRWYQKWSLIGCSYVPAYEGACMFRSSAHSQADW